MSYLNPPNGHVPNNALTIGYLYHHRDSRTFWQPDHMSRGTPCQPLTTPDKAGMYMTAVWVFVRDEAEIAKTRPSFRFSFYKDVSNHVTPLGATKICETPVYQIRRNNVPDLYKMKWNRCEFKQPEHWARKEKQWMVRDGYNGDYRLTRDFEFEDNNKDGYIDEQPYWIVPNDRDNSAEPRIETIREHGAYLIKKYYKQFIFYIEYTIGVPTYGTAPTPEPPDEPPTTEERLTRLEGFHAGQ